MLDTELKTAGKSVQGLGESFYVVFFVYFEPIP